MRYTGRTCRMKRTKTLKTRPEELQHLVADRHWYRVETKKENLEQEGPLKPRARRFHKSMVSISDDSLERSLVNLVTVSLMQSQVENQIIVGWVNWEIRKLRQCIQTIRYALSEWCLESWMEIFFLMVKRELKKRQEIEMRFAHHSTSYHILILWPWPTHLTFLDFIWVEYNFISLGSRGWQLSSLGLFLF